MSSTQIELTVQPEAILPPSYVQAFVYNKILLLATNPIVIEMGIAMATKQTFENSWK